MKYEVTDCVGIAEYRDGRFCPFSVVLFAFGGGATHGRLFAASVSVSNPAAIPNHP